MCLLCEELWMPFEPPPEAKPRTFVADAPEPDAPPSQADRAATSTPDASSNESGQPPAESSPTNSA